MVLSALMGVNLYHPPTQKTISSRNSLIDTPRDNVLISFLGILESSPVNTKELIISESDFH